MDRHQALEFLEKHQPLPKLLSSSMQADLTNALIRLREDPADPEKAVPLLLNCWNCWQDDTNGEAIIYTLKSYPCEWIGPLLAMGLEDADRDRRLWFAEVACSLPHPQCEAALSRMLECESEQERFVAACALERIASPAVRAHARRRLGLETDPETIEVLEAIVAGN